MSQKNPPGASPSAAVEDILAYVLQLRGLLLRGQSSPQWKHSQLKDTCMNIVHASFSLEHSSSGNDCPLLSHRVPKCSAHVQTLHVHATPPKPHAFTEKRQVVSGVCCACTIPPHARDATEATRGCTTEGLMHPKGVMHQGYAPGDVDHMQSTCNPEATSWSSFI